MTSSTEIKIVNSKAARIITAVLFAFVLIAGGLFVYQYKALGNTIEQERITYVTEIKEQLMGNIAAEKTQQMSAIALYCSSIQKLRPTRFSDVRDLLDGSRMEPGDEIFFLDDEGTLYDLYGNKNRLSNDTLAQRLLLDREGIFSYAQVNNTDEYWFYGVPFEVASLDGVPIRAILSARNIENFSAGMATSILNNEGVTFVTSRDGNVLLFPPVENMIGYSLFNSLLHFGTAEESVAQMRDDFEHGRDGQRFLEYGGNRWLISYSGDVFDDWVVVVLMPMTVTAADTYRMLNYTMLTVALLVGGSMALLLFLVNLFYRRERAREQMIHEEKLRLEVIRRTAESKNQFLAKMSHDIRTPLNAIMGLLQIARGQVAGQPGVEENLSKVEYSAEYLLSILNDILDMSKIEDGKMTLSREPFSMEAVVKTVETINRIQAERKGVRFDVEKRGEVSPRYMGDQLRLKQILMNLLSNAIKFTEKDGTVSLCLAVSPENGADHVVIAVEDTGIGMSEEYLTHIFQPFEQESPDIARTYAGSGLGLSIVKSLVELMGGTISVESRKGAGSRFEVSLSLPRAEEAEAARAEDAANEEDLARISLNGLKVLLAEDNDINAEIATELLASKCGIRVDWARNGKEAVERFEASAPGEYAAILMDIRMPVMDGLEAAARIRKTSHPSASAVPIIAMSANAFAEDVALSLERGMNAHLSKPIDIVKLERTLKIHIGKGV